jgi:hypothetical protein
MAADSWPNLRQSSWPLVALLLGVLLSAGAQPCRAQQQPQPSASDRETARALMQEGDDLTARGDLQNALARYSAAHALVRIPTIGLEVARTQDKLGHLVEARGLALEVSNSTPVAGEPALFARARTAATELARDLAVRIPSLRTEVNPPLATYTVTIDGVALPNAARTIAYRTNPGMHTVIVSAPGYVSQRREVKLPEGQLATLTVTLPPTGAAPIMPAPAPAPNVGR